jgi:D-lactate dehydrogenase (cytochrome)
VTRRIPTRPLPAVAPPPAETDPDLVRRYLEDAAHYPGGRALAVVRPSNVAQLATAIARAERALVVGARSSLTGGATPLDDVVIATERLQDTSMAGERVTVGAGVTLDSLQQQLAGRGYWLPPVPTFLGATAGGAASTNAAGAATFKYGTMRRWIEGLAVVLPDGALLELHRGEAVASESGTFELATARGSVAIPVPAIRMPDVPKCSAGYFSAPAMDLVDLFVGSEGTLGAIASVTFRVAPKPAAVCWASVPVPDESRAIALVSALRRAAQLTWRTRDPRGVDVAAIEHIDRRALEILEEDGVNRRLNVAAPPGTAVVLLVQVELTGEAAARDLWSDISNARALDAPDTPLVRLCRLLDDHGVLDDSELVLPNNPTRRAALIEFREATPASVNRRVALAQAQVDERIHKTASDPVVPFDRFAEMMTICRRLFAARGVDLAVWGHISDGNVHPNVVPRSYADIEVGKALMLELGREVIAMGGSPLAEHGVGRSALKQQLLRMLYGDEGIQSMQRVKTAIDPGWKLARGVLFPAPGGA